jgi:hypothetical protein
MLNLGHVFFAAASCENDQGSMNLASKTAPVPSTTPSSVAAIQRSTASAVPQTRTTTKIVDTSALIVILRDNQILGGDEPPNFGGQFS